MAKLEINKLFFKQLRVHGSCCKTYTLCNGGSFSALEGTVRYESCVMIDFHQSLTCLLTSSIPPILFIEQLLLTYHRGFTELHFVLVRYNSIQEKVHRLLEKRHTVLTNTIQVKMVQRHYQFFCFHSSYCIQAEYWTKTITRRWVIEY